MTDNNNHDESGDFFSKEERERVERFIEKHKNLDFDGPHEYIYYLAGVRPLRVGYIHPHIPVIAEVLNFETKKFEINNMYISYAAKSLDYIKLTEQEFVNECLKNGVKPPPKKK